MRAKDFVQDKCPTAYAEKQVRGKIKGMQETYYLIRERGQTMYIASGKSESNAWVNAKRAIIDQECRDFVKHRP